MSNHLSKIDLGLILIKDFIPEEEENNLIQFIDSMPWCLDLKRKTQHYGYKYNYSKKSIDKSDFLGDFPEYLKNFSNKIVPYLKQFPQQIIVNEYLKGQGIAHHIDRPDYFGPIVISLSLLSDCEMTFKNKSLNQVMEKLLLPRRSLLILNDLYRYELMHGINENAIKERRVSVTFRTILKG